ncbi:MAG: NAD(P)-dependent oxidoreductase [Gemmatimonadaceae bacterium]|nr:NAD(P)-dependent oxidoreductase [Gemmatimonadaceae bacterium]MBA3657344.1 NAD(P)-dependent oxidoreductase [Gemmatimonadaceae bacterium]
MGRTVVAELRARGKTVLACGHDPESCEATWDVTQADGPTTSEIPHTIVHAAARRASIDEDKRDEALWDVNVAGTARVVEWGLQNEVKQIVVISGALVYGSWTEPRKEDDEPNAALAGYYALSKWASEQIALAACKEKCELAILRLSSLYGAAYKQGLIRHFLAQARDDGRIRVDPPLDDAFDLLHLNDAAATVANAVEFSAKGLWNVGSGGVHSLLEIAETCASVAGATVEQSRRRPRRAARILNWVDDAPARAELGHRNGVPLIDGVREIASST